MATIGPWRATPAPLPGGPCALPRSALHPSGRQALTATLVSLGLGRPDLVAIPAWSSACVIGAVGRAATPVPLALASGDAGRIDAVLVYEQWGWRRPDVAFAGIRRTFPRTAIIRDRVDTADLGLAAKGTPEPDIDASVWSLSKVLGVYAGGYARVRGGWLPGSADESHRRLAEALRDASTPAATDMAKTSVAILPAADESALRSADIVAACAAERARRLANLAAVRGSGLDVDWPAWMDAAAAAGGPGLCPLMPGASPSVLEAARKALASAADIDAPVYRFDVAADQPIPDYRPCLALPLHGEMDPDRVASIARLLRGAPVDSRT